jgi:NAD(P)-dependent dehydrogenase (short-subunit alcohol dehydrogenase family)
MIAKGFVEAGANVLLTSRDEKACSRAASEIGGSCRYVASDVSTRQGCEDLADKIATSSDGEFFPDGGGCRRLDVLIHNAGTSWGEPMERDSGRRSNWGWDKVLDLNVKGIFYLTRACLPLLTDRNPKCDARNPSRVITIGSVAGITPQGAPTHAYDVSKAAVHHLTRKLASELAPKHVTVNCVAPGYFDTRMSQGLSKWGADADKLASGVPLGRLGEPSDIAGSCIFLSSPAGSWCTGVVLPVDGGCIGASVIPLSSNL